MTLNCISTSNSVINFTTLICKENVRLWYTTHTGQEPWYCSVCLVELLPFNGIYDAKKFDSKIGDDNAVSNYDRQRAYPLLDLFPEKDDNRIFLNSEDLDPDGNYFINNYWNSKYVIPAEADIVTRKPKNSYNCPHQLLKHHTQIRRHKIIAFPVTGGILIVTETWLTDYMNYLVDISGYYFLSKHRLRRGGGIGVFMEKMT